MDSGDRLTLFFFAEGWLGVFRRKLLILGLVTGLVAGIGAPSYADGASVSYDRSGAASWAMEYAPLNSSSTYDDTCTWFVTLDLQTHGFPADDQWTTHGSHGFLHPLPGSSTAWVAPQLINYLQSNYDVSYNQLNFGSGGYVNIPVQPGDIIAYDLGYNPSSGYGFTPDHLAIVVNVIQTPQGAYPEVAEWGHDAYYTDRYGNATDQLADYAKRGWTWSEEHQMWLQSWYNDSQYGGISTSPNANSGINIQAYLLHFNF